MIFIIHRVNTVKKLSAISKEFGVEIDLRSQKNKIYLHHDPYKNGELFSKWVKSYNHKLIVLNVKEEGLETKIIKILKKANIKNYFFHDQSFSTLIKTSKFTKVSVRTSEYEKLSSTKTLFKKIKWIWVDHFTKFSLGKNLYKELKKNKIKICIVSPELINNKKIIKKIKFIKKIINKNNFIINAVCTKNVNLWK
jgi:hypothetical protein